MLFASSPSPSFTPGAALNHSNSAEQGWDVIEFAFWSFMQNIALREHALGY